MYYMSAKQQYQLKKVLSNQNPNQGGVKLVLTDYERETSQEIFLLYKLWPGEKIADGRNHLVTIFFDQEDLEKGEFRTHNEGNRFFGSSSTTDISDSIDGEFGYIQRNFRGWDNSDIEVQEIEPELLKEIFEDDNVQDALRARLQIVDENTPEVPSKNISDFVKAAKKTESEQQIRFANLVVKFTNRMIKEFGLDLAKFDWRFDEARYGGYYAGAYFWFKDGFDFKWTRDCYGRTEFTIERNTPASIKQMKKSIGIKEWTMGQSYSDISEQAYNSYRNFAQRIIDRGRGNWKVSLDLEE